MSNKEFMVKVAAADNVREVYEVPSTTLARAVDSLHYTEHKEVAYVGCPTPLPIDTFGPFAFVEIETGHEDVVGAKTVVFVKHGQDHHVNY